MMILITTLKAIAKGVGMNKHGNIGNKNAAKSSTLESQYTGRCTTEEKAAWVKAASSKRITLQEFTRSALNAEADINNKIKRA